MSQPSWFYPSNSLSTLATAASEQRLIADSSFELPVADNHERLRTLWFLSFVEDIRTFTIASEKFATEGLRRYPSVENATRLLYSSRSPPEPDLLSQQYPDSEDDARLRCLFYILIVLRETGGNPSSPDDSEMVALDTVLRDSEAVWLTSVADLPQCIFQGHAEQVLDGPRKIAYVRNLMEMVRWLSPDAKRRVEQCLFHILGADDGDGDGAEPDSSVDTFLAEMRGISRHLLT